jgi:hypothetical protein
MIDTDAGISLTINKNSAKWMQLPRDVLVGHGVLEEVGDVCRDLNLQAKEFVTSFKLWISIRKLFLRAKPRWKK